MSSEGIEFWYQNLGRHLSDAPPAESSKASVPTRLGKDGAVEGKGKRVGPNVLGAGIDAYYVASQARSIMIGKIALPDSDAVRFLASDGPVPVRPMRAIARWLVEEASFPFMVGVIGKASPNASFRVSHHPAMCTFCASSGGFTFNIAHVRADVALIEGLPWNIVAQGIHAYAAYAHAEGGTASAGSARDKLAKQLDKTPDLRRILPMLNARPHSGEYELLRAYYSE